MQILKGHDNIFDLPCDAVCVTTNGVVKRDGSAVMGAGIAREADQRYHLARTLGGLLASSGNHCFDLGIRDNRHVISFPTKHDWRDDSDPDLIRQSCKELVEIADQNALGRILLPPVGCGCGKLSWDTVSRILSESLDNRFIVYFRVR